jgi:hypothetical protein
LVTKKRKVEIDLDLTLKAYEVKLRDAERQIGKLQSKIGKPIPVKVTGVEGAVNQVGKLSFVFNNLKTTLQTLSAPLREFNDEALRVEAAAKGLDKIAKFKGVEGANEAVKNLKAVKSGIIDLATAQTSLKNLLASGYNLEQSIQTLDNLSEAAVYGRAAHLDMAGAVLTATEGLRQNRSTLVDNSGVTRNLSDMVKDYAKEVGISTARLTEQQKIQAVVNGIQKETLALQGSINEVTNSSAGAQLRAQAEYKKTRAELGILLQQVITPLAENSIPVLQFFNGLSSGMQTTALAAGGLLAVFIKFPGALVAIRTAVMTLYASMGPAGWLVLGLTAAATAMAYFSSEAEEGAYGITTFSKEVEKIPDNLKDVEAALKIAQEKFNELYAAAGRPQIINPETELGKAGAWLGRLYEAYKKLGGAIDETAGKEQESFSLREALRINERDGEISNAQMADQAQAQLQANRAQRDQVYFEQQKNMIAEENAARAQAALEESQRKYAQMQLQQMVNQSAISGLASLMYSWRGSNRVLFEIGKRAAQAQALLNFFSGLERTRAAYPFPLSIPFVAAHALVSAANLAKLESVSFASGGPVRPANIMKTRKAPRGDDGLAFLGVNEFVVNRQSAQKNFAALMHANQGGKIVPSFADGGPVGNVPTAAAQPNIDIASMAKEIGQNVQINIYTEIDGLEFVRDNMEQINRIETQRRYG